MLRGGLRENAWRGLSSIRVDLGQREAIDILLTLRRGVFAIFDVSEDDEVTKRLITSNNDC